MKRRTLALTLGALLLLPAAGFSAPQGGTVASGSGTITHPTSSTTVINQSTGQVIINWNNFSIGASETVKFVQPSPLDVALNRVTGIDPSIILGSLQANGRVFLINPNGILFGPNSTVDIGTLVASTLDVSDSDFLKGTYQLSGAGGKPGSYIVNEGQINAADGGSVVLVAPLVSNQGTIVANLGHVSLAATGKAELDVDGHGLIDVVVPVQSSCSGNVLITQDAYTKVLQKLFQQSNPVLTSDGSVLLVKGSGVLVDTGTIQANGASGTTAGSVDLHAQSSLVVSPDAVIQANGAGDHSNGGQVNLTSAGAVSFSGCIQARGGTSGNGGRVEVSGQGGIISGRVDTSAAQGKRGNFLIDPVDLSIVGGCGGNATCNQLLTSQKGALGFCDGASQATIGAHTISNLSKTTCVTLEATHSITVQCLKTTGTGTPSGVITLQGGSLVMETQTGNIVFVNPSDAIAATGSGSIVIGAGETLVVGAPLTCAVKQVCFQGLGTGASVKVGKLSSQGGCVWVAADGNVCVGQAVANGAGKHVFIVSSTVGNVTVGQASADGNHSCGGSLDPTVGATINGVFISANTGNVSVGRATANGCKGCVCIGAVNGNIKVDHACANGCHGIVCIGTLGTGNVQVSQACANGSHGAIFLGTVRGTGNTTVTAANANGTGGVVVVDAICGNVTLGTASASGGGGKVFVVAENNGSVLAAPGSHVNVVANCTALLGAPGGVVGGVCGPVNVCIAPAGHLLTIAGHQIADLSVNLSGTLAGATTGGLIFNPQAVFANTCRRSCLFCSQFQSVLTNAPIPPGFILFNDLVVNPPSFLSESQFLSDTPGYFSEMLLTANGQKLVAPSLIELIDDQEELSMPVRRPRSTPKGSQRREEEGITASPTR